MLYRCENCGYYCTLPLGKFLSIDKSYAVDGSIQGIHNRSMKRVTAPCLTPDGQWTVQMGLLWSFGAASIQATMTVLQWCAIWFVWPWEGMCMSIIAAQKRGHHAMVQTFNTSRPEWFQTLIDSKISSRTASIGGGPVRFFYIDFRFE